MIEVDRLTKIYGRRRALDGVSFRIDSGEIVGLLGLNAAGKTTTLRILSGLLLPSEGSITIDGIDARAESRAMRGRVGYLPHLPPLYPEMAVRDYLLFAAGLRQMPEARARVDEVLERIGLVDVRHERNGDLSHGYRQRVGIAQAIVHRPKVLLLDEPSNGLDPVQAAEMRHLLRSFAGEHTVLLSSHLLFEISQVVDRVLLLHRGVIAADGPVDNLAARLGSHEIVLLVRGDRELARRVVASTPGVLGCEIARADADAVEIRVELGQDTRADLARAVVEAGLDLLRLDRQQLDLEHAFLRLTGNAHDEPSEEASANHRPHLPA